MYQQFDQRAFPCSSLANKRDEAWTAVFPVAIGLTQPHARSRLRILRVPFRDQISVASIVAKHQRVLLAIDAFFTSVMTLSCVLAYRTKWHSCRQHVAVQTRRPLHRSQIQAEHAAQGRGLFSDDPAASSYEGFLGPSICRNRSIYRRCRKTGWGDSCYSSRRRKRRDRRLPCPNQSPRWSESNVGRPPTDKVHFWNFPQPNTDPRLRNEHAIPPAAV